MKQKENGNMFSEAIFKYEKKQSQKNKTGEKRSVVVMTLKSTIIIGISCLVLLISFLEKC